MTNPTPDIPILDDDAISEIEALSAKVPDGPWFAAADDADDVPDHRRSGLALVDTGRSADWWIARLCEWHIARFIAESKTNVDALCQTVRAERERLAAMREKFSVSSTERERDLESQLEQVTEERNDLQVHIEERDSLLSAAPDAATSMRSACIEKVKSLPDHATDCNVHLSRVHVCSCSFRAEAIKALESVSIQEQK